MNTLIKKLLNFKIYKCEGHEPGKYSFEDMVELIFSKSKL